MSDLSQTIEAGTFLTFSDGEYSDKCTGSPARVLKTFVKADVVAEFDRYWRARPKDPYADNNPCPDDFVCWMFRQGYVEDTVNCHDWHVGSYGQFQP